MYLVSKIERENNGVFRIKGDSTSFYKVNLNEWCCDCKSFTTAGYTCKHMFACIFEESITIFNKDYKNLKTFNGCYFKFLNQFRENYSKEETFKKFIKHQIFAVTIGETAFKSFYLEKVNKINLC